MNRKFNKMVLFTLILFISIGFAVLTTNLSMVANLAFRENTFDVHFENSKVLSTSTSIDNTVTIDTNNPTSLSFTTTLTKPTDYIEFTFYVVNNGTVDAQLSSINVGLTTEQLNYISYTLTYDIDGTTVSANDYLYKGQYKRIKAHFEYRYDIDNLYSSGTLNTTITFNYIQPQTVTTTVWTYDYSEAAQYFIAPKTGSYKIELWGASGGALVDEDKGLGSYTSGKINLEKNKILYIYVGESGGYAYSQDATQIFSFSNSFNSGSSANTQYGVSDRYWGVGGGATDVRLVSGNWDSFSSLKSRIMVAGAGGGGYESYESQNVQSPIYKRYGGAGGGLIGYQGFQMNYLYGHGGTGGSQTSGGYSECLESEGCLTTIGYNAVGSFGIAGYRIAVNGSTGGGSGYFGGGGSTHVQGAGGGSSYISGHIGCVAIEGTSTSNNITFPTKNGVLCDDGTIDIECSKHYSGKYFTDTKMIDGKGYEWKYHSGDAEVTASDTVVGMPTFDGTGTMTGNSGNGYAKITFIG